MNNSIIFDTETVSLEGPLVLIQYSIGEGEIILWEAWKNTFKENINLIEMMMNHQEGVMGFNVTFDAFQICKWYTICELFLKKHPSKSNELPENYIDELGVLEKEARDGSCIKPKKVFDIMVHARKGPYQSTMNRKSIIIKKVPIQLAMPLMQKLEQLIPLKDIYFARRKDKYASKWQIEEIKGSLEFRNLILRFKPSSALKALYVDAFNIKETTLYSEISIGKKLYPESYAFAPFALAVAPNYLKDKNWQGSWPAKIKYHIEHWHSNEAARIYASNDVKYTRELYSFFNDPEMDDDDSNLTWLIGAARWRGYAINIEKIKLLKQEALIKAKAAPKDARRVRTYIGEVLSPIEQIIIRESTKKIILEELAEQKDDCDCVIKGLAPLKNCTLCNETGFVSTEAAIRAQKVLDARRSTKEIENYDKLILAERFHASSSVIGALSGRMSGSGGGINSQGIKKTKQVRSCFPLAFKGDILTIGDFVSFEVVLADSCYNDPDLRAQLQSGKSIHGLFGALLYPGKNYEDIMKSKGTDLDLYTRSKSGLFAVLYGGTTYTLMTRLGITAEAAEEGYLRFTQKYKKIGLERNKITERFCSMKQPNGIGGKVEWHQPEDYVESMFGFKRYFTLENKICKALFDLAEKPPKEWTQLKIHVTRRDREQTVSGAVRSALFASAFMIQSSNTRAAINHVIQSSGATLTKKLQRNIWDLQKPGINEWLVQPMNIHDELINPCKKKMVSKVKEVVDNFIEEYKKIVPLLEMDWKNYAETWADK